MPELTHSASVIAGSPFISIYALIEYVLFISKHLSVVVVLELLGPWVPAACWFSNINCVLYFEVAIISLLFIESYTHVWVHNNLMIHTIILWTTEQLNHKH